MWPNVTVDILPQKMLGGIIKLHYFDQLFAKVRFHEQLWAVLIFGHLCSQPTFRGIQTNFRKSAEEATVPIVGKLT